MYNAILCNILLLVLMFVFYTLKTFQDKMNVKMNIVISFLYNLFKM